MRLTAGAAPHLTYCTNIHPGERWGEVRENLERHVLAVREQVAPGRRFGVGLRLSGLAAQELSEPAAFNELADFLAKHDLYVFTINGFPYGPFHGQPVKEEVYRPDWSEEERLLYSNRLADLLARLLPEGVDGTISTVPIAFAPRVGSAADAGATAARIGRHAAHLWRIRQRTGKHISLALEPEPCCYLETIEQTTAFFGEHLFTGAGLDAVMAEVSASADEALQVVRQHVGVCLDACHMAVEFEEPTQVLAALRDAGIAVPKVQISAGLRVDLTGDPHADAELLTQLERFADSVYLHQVVEQRVSHSREGFSRHSRESGNPASSPAGGLRRFLDLPEAIRSAREQPRPCEWRIHFHVPLFREKLGVFQSTQPYVAELIRLLQQEPDRGQHWEVETYTWDVLPEEHRRERVADAVAREMRWVLSQTPGWTGAPA